MKLPISLVSGKFGPDDIIVSISPSDRKIDPGVESQLEDVWNKMVAKATASGKVCYNGMSYSID